MIPCYCLILQSCGLETMLMIIIPPSLIKAIRKNSYIPQSGQEYGSFNPFEASDQFIDNAKRSYFETLEKEQRVIRERSNSFKPKP